MNDQQQWWLRLGLLTELVSQAPCKLGRTALMKLAYLLQTVKEVPLGYDFRLYTYGPFDSDVLNDLGLAESLGGVRSEMVSFPNGSGYGYQFTPGPAQASFATKVENDLAHYQPAVQWALKEFGKQSAADLELVSTIIYADREAASHKEPISFQELCRRVHEVKPRFTKEYIAEKVDELAVKGLVIATKESGNRP